MRIKLIMTVLMALAGAVTLNAQDIHYNGAISAYRLITKSENALTARADYDLMQEQWSEYPFRHVYTKLATNVRKWDYAKVEGRVSESRYGARSGSQVALIQRFIVRGMEFDWHVEEKKWESKTPELTEKWAREELQEGLTYSLYGVNDQNVDMESARYLGEEVRDEKKCHHVSYKLDEGVFKRRGRLGSVRVDLWIDTETFLPVEQRLEGSDGPAQVVSVSSYGYDSAQEMFPIPPAIVKEAETRKKQLEAKIPTLIGDVAQLRGWDAGLLKDVSFEFVSKDRVRQESIEYLVGIYDKDDLYYSGEVLKWARLLPQDADYVESSLSGMDGSYVAGMYLPQKKKVLIGDYIPLFEAETSLVHEITHAFQDALLDMQKSTIENKYNSDRNEALMSFFEGEAMAVQHELLFRKDDGALQDWRDIAGLVEERALQGEYVRDKILFNKYGNGVRFVQAFLNKNSWRWETLSEVYRLLPATTEDILHPPEYFLGQIVATAQTDWSKQQLRLEAGIPEGWERVHSDRMGESFIFTFLDRGMTGPLAANEACVGWADDNVAVLKKGEHTAIVFLTAWDTEKDAQQFYETYVKWLKNNSYTQPQERTDAQPAGAGQETAGQQPTEAPAGNIFTHVSKSDLTGVKHEQDRVLIVWSRDLSADDFRSLYGSVSVR